MWIEDVIVRSGKACSFQPPFSRVNNINIPLAGGKNGDQVVKLSGYHYFMDRLRSAGKLVFYCGCGQTTKVEENMPLTMRCFCDKLMVVMDENDSPEYLIHQGKKEEEDATEWH